MKQILKINHKNHIYNSLLYKNIIIRLNISFMKCFGLQMLLVSIFSFSIFKAFAQTFDTWRREPSLNTYPFMSPIYHHAHSQIHSVPLFFLLSVKCSGDAILLLKKLGMLKHFLLGILRLLLLILYYRFTKYDLKQTIRWLTVDTESVNNYFYFCSKYEQQHSNKQLLSNKRLETVYEKKAPFTWAWWHCAQIGIAFFAAGALLLSLSCRGCP